MNGAEDIERLKTIPGVGDKTALAFAAYVGDGKRFNNGDEVTNYLGLVPRVDCSGSINRYGHITKKGNRIVRALLYQAAWSIVRSKLRRRVKGKILLYDGAWERKENIDTTDVDYTVPFDFIFKVNKNINRIGYRIII